MTTKYLAKFQSPTTVSLPLAKHLVVTTFVSAMLGDIDLIFDL
jgi:hypothetical protein